MIYTASTTRRRANNKAVVRRSDFLLGSNYRFRSQKVLGEREVFLVFIKVLFKCIERSDDSRLRLRAKYVVSECTRRSRNGESDFSPLQEAVETHLKSIVGDAYWDQAKTFTSYFCKSRNLQTLAAV